MRCVPVILWKEPFLSPIGSDVFSFQFKKDAPLRQFIHDITKVQKNYYSLAEVSFGYYFTIIWYLYEKSWKIKSNITLFADPDNIEGRDQLWKDVRRAKSKCDHLLKTFGDCPQSKSASCYRSQVIIKLLRSHF